MTDLAGKAHDYTPAIASRRVPDSLAGERLDRALAQMFPEHSRSRLQKWLLEGRVHLDASAAKPKQKIWGGELVVVRPGPSEAAVADIAEDIALDVVFEDDEVLVLNKPAGLVVHPGSGNWRGTLLNALLHHAAALSGLPRAGIVHRLDKDTSGLLVVAKTLRAQTDLVRQLQAHTVKRIYLAVVRGSVSHAGEIEAPVGRDPHSRTRMAVVDSGRFALTRYKVVRKFADATLLECSLSTGRTHQIRVHLQSVGHPLLGDPVYGGSGRRRNADTRIRRQALHAARLGFLHPATGDARQFAAPLPEDMEALLAALETTE